MSILTSAAKERFAGRQRVEALLKLSWEAEIFGTGMMEALAEMHPAHAETLTAAANMEWFNVHYCARFGHSAGMHISVEQAEKLGRLGGALSRKLRTFEKAAKLMVLETPAASMLYKRLGKLAANPELRALADDLYEHENAMTAWFKSELDGESDGGKRVLAYLERHGINRKMAVTPRKHREDFGGDKQQLVLATFGEEDTADEAANRLKEWERSSEELKFDAIGVLVKNKRGNVKGRKLGGGLMGVLFPHGLKVTDENLARIGHKFDASQASVGVLTWDFESRVVSNKLRDLGGIPQTHEVAKLRA